MTTDYDPTESEVYAVNAICRRWKEATGVDTDTESARLAMMAARAAIRSLCCPEGCSIDKHRAEIGPRFADAFGKCWASLPGQLFVDKRR